MTFRFVECLNSADSIAIRMLTVLYLNQEFSEYWRSEHYGTLQLSITWNIHLRLESILYKLWQIFESIPVCVYLQKIKINIMVEWNIIKFFLPLMIFPFDFNWTLFDLFDIQFYFNVCKIDMFVRTRKLQDMSFFSNTILYIMLIVNGQLSL